MISNLIRYIIGKNIINDNFWKTYGNIPIMFSCVKSEDYYTDDGNINENMAWYIIDVINPVTKRKMFTAGGSRKCYLNDFFDLLKHKRYNDFKQTIEQLDK